MKALRPAGDGVHLTVQVQPRAKANQWGGPHGDALRVRVAAPPVGGKANKELIGFVAETFGIAKGAVNILRGERNRRKVLALQGVSLDEARSRLSKQMELL